MPMIDWNAPTSGFVLPDLVEYHSRNNTMFSYLCSLRAKGATDAQLGAEAHKVNAERFKPPLDEHELGSVIRSAQGYDMGDGTYSGSDRPTSTMPKSLPTITRDVPIDVLPDLSDMTPNEQAKAYIRACFDGVDVDDDGEETPWTDTICLSRDLESPWDDAYEYAGTLLGGCGYEALDRFLPYTGDGGMWCCVNPLLPERIDPDTGKMVSGYRRNKTSVAAYRNILVESDDLPMDEQLRLMLKLFWDDDGKKRGLLRAITDSGGKSYHCILRTNQKRDADYRVDVEFIYALCEKHGLIVDRKCGNPTRMTRFPGAVRHGTGRMQRLVWAYGV